MTFVAGRGGAPATTHPHTIAKSSRSPKRLHVRPLEEASDSDTVALDDAARGRSLAQLNGHTRDVYAAFFSPDGTRVLATSLDDRARSWDAATGATLAVFRTRAR
ncbi:MAG: WD40 repeat domain-containing protein [Phycisphaerales bacterium]